MNKLTISISTISLLFAIAGFKFFEDARVERCITKLGPATYVGTAESLLGMFPDYLDGKSPEQIKEYKIELRKSEQKNYDAWSEQYDQCKKRITPPNWSNFFIDLTL